MVISFYDCKTTFVMVRLYNFSHKNLFFHLPNFSSTELKEENEVEDEENEMLVEQENSAINEITDEYDEDILIVEEEMEEDAQAYEDAEYEEDEEKLEDEIEAATDDEKKEELEEDLEEDEIEKDDIDEEYEEVSQWGCFVMISTVR